MRGGRGARRCPALGGTSGVHSRWSGRRETACLTHRPSGGSVEDPLAGMLEAESVWLWWARRIAAETRSIPWPSAPEVATGKEYDDTQIVCSRSRSPEGYSLVVSRCARGTAGAAHRVLAARRADSLPQVGGSPGHSVSPERQATGPALVDHSARCPWKIG